MMEILKEDHEETTTTIMMMEKMKIQRSSTDLRVWQCVKEIGFGAFGDVSLATTNPSSSLPPQIAVKTSEVLSSHDHEKNILSKFIGCDSIIRYYGEDCSVTEDGSMQYHLLLEFASKGSLHDCIRKNVNRKLSETQVEVHTYEILQGLKNLHDSGYVHCDIKPQNILICEDDKAKIADFGMSKRIEDKEDINSGLRGPRGTPIYMAPETMMPEKPLYVPEPPCDVWALGCVVLEMLTGEPLWKNCSPVLVLFRLMQLNELGQEGLPALPTGVSEPAKDFLDKCLIIDSESRWTVDQLLNHPFIHQVKIQETTRNTSTSAEVKVADYPCTRRNTSTTGFHFHTAAIC